MFRDRLVKRLSTLHPCGDVADDEAQIALPLRVALLVKSGQGLDERNSRLDHGCELAGEKNNIGLFGRPRFLARAAGLRLLLKGKDHEPTAHQTGYSIVLIERILDAGYDATGGV